MVIISEFSVETLNGNKLVVRLVAILYVKKNPGVVHIGSYSVNFMRI